MLNLNFVLCYIGNAIFYPYHWIAIIFLCLEASTTLLHLIADTFF